MVNLNLSYILRSYTSISNPYPAQRSQMGLCMCGLRRRPEGRVVHVRMDPSGRSIGRCGRSVGREVTCCDGAK